MGMVKIYAEIPKNSPKCEAPLVSYRVRLAIQLCVHCGIGFSFGLGWRWFFSNISTSMAICGNYICLEKPSICIFWMETRDGETISGHPIKIRKGNSEIPSSHLHARWPGGPILLHSVLSKNAWAYRHITQWLSYEKTCWFVHQIWCSLGWSEPWSMNSKYLP